MRPIDADAFRDEMQEYVFPITANNVMGAADAYYRTIHLIDDAPTIKSVPLADIYRIIAGHSDYHGDNILAALTCIAEGKAVNPVKPLEAEPVRHALWEECDWVEFDRFECVRYPKKGRVCTNCRNAFKKEFVDDRRVRFCPHCGVKMASGAKPEGMTDLLADFSEVTDLEHMTRFAMLQAFKNK